MRLVQVHRRKVIEKMPKMWVGVKGEKVVVVCKLRHELHIQILRYFSMRKDTLLSKKMYAIFEDYNINRA